MRPVAIILAILAAVSPAILSADEPGNRSLTQQVLDRFVGTWDIKMTLTAPGKEPVQKDISETRRLSSGGAVLMFENPSTPEFHMMWTYDPTAKKYIGVWLYGGDRGTLTGNWDEGTSTMKFQGTGADGNTFVNTFRLIDKDHSESTAIYHDRDGKIVSEVTWKHTRRGK